MADSDSWEALDVDDSDLQSLIKPSPPPQPILLPCKRSSTHQTLQTPNSQSHTPLLSPSPQLSRQSPQPLQGIASTSSAEHRRIPGPAGALQASMQRRAALAKRNEGFREEEISTHDYIKRVQEIEGEDEDEDEDFKLNPWLCAMEFVGRIGGFVNSPLNSIKGSSMSTDRLDQVVAVVKSCAPNGFGDLIVTLKDPTGTVGASIHRNVVTGSDFGKDISVGCVLILQKVVVFSTSRSAHNLNVTLRNVVKVVGKDSGPPTRHNLASIISGVRSDTEHVEKRASVVGRASADEIVNRMVREKMKGKAVVDVDRQMEDCSRGGEEEMVNAEDHNMQTLMDKLEDNAEIGAKAGSVGRDNNIEEETANNIAQRSIIPEDDFNSNSSSRYQLTSAKSQSRERESVRTTASMKERQHLISKATLPEWTDEQLDELFAASFDDE